MKRYANPIRSWRAALAAALLIAGALVAVQVTAAAPAFALPGLQLYPGTPIANEADGTTSAIVSCPLNKHATGGGVVINDNGQHRVFVTSVMPVRGGSSAGGDHIVVSGAAPPGFTGAWTIQPYAVCANSSALPNYQIVPDTEFPASSSTAREFHVLCTGSKRAVGSGAAIVDGGREVGLTAYRTDEPRGLARAYGEEDASGFGDAWRLQAFAICADPLPNFSVQASLQPGPTGRQVCPTGSFVHGPGGGAGTGGFFLQRLVPTADLRQLEVSGTAVDPAVGVLLHFTCAP